MIRTYFLFNLDVMSVGVWRRGSAASGRHFTAHSSAEISVFRALVLTAASEVVRAVTAAVPSLE